MIVIERSPSAGYFRIDGIDYPKGHFRIKYDNIKATEDQRNFSLYNIYNESKLVTSRGYAEIQDVSSWAELMRLFNVLGVLENNDVTGSADSIPMYQFMDTVGDGNGEINQAVDGETVNVSYFVVPPAGKVYGLARIIFSIRDNGSMDSGGWGSMGANPLDNGFQLIWHRLGSDIELTKNPIRSHIDVAAVCHDMIHQNWGAGDEFLTARFTFTKAGNYLILDGDQGDYLELVVRDDISSVVQQRISVQGYQK